MFPTLATRTSLRLLAGCLLILSFAPGNAGASQAMPHSLAPMLEKVLPGVVNISTRTRVQEKVRVPLLNDPIFRRFFNIPEQTRERESQSLGSGVIVDARKGYIFTNVHVVEDADEITVTLRDGRSFSANLVGQDPDSDIALLQVEAKGLTAVPLAASDRLRVGDFVVAIGNPFGLGQTVTSGIISALGRTDLGIEGYEDFIQTDASINPGNSGGALVTLDGELAGINTAIVGPTGGNIGIGFAIPSNMLKAVMPQLIKHGEVRRGRLGVAVQDLTPDLAHAFGLKTGRGAVVAQVAPDSAAEKAGLKAGDVIVGMNGKPLASGSTLRNAIGLIPVGSRITLDVLREATPMTLHAVIEAPKAVQVEATRVSEKLTGSVLGPIQPDHPLAGRAEGVEVLKVERGSPAWESGLRPGDIIVSVNRQPVKSVQDVPAALNHSGNSLLLNIRRGDSALFIVIR